jgi:hypothetical protein
VSQSTYAFGDSDAVLEEYLDIATALIAQHGGNMYAGPRLAALPLTGTAAVRLGEVAVVPAAAAHAARPDQGRPTTLPVARFASI